MNALLSLGKWFLILPVFVFGLFHFMNTEALAAMAPGGALMVYISGAGLILSAVSMIIGKLDKLAAVLLAVLLLLFTIPHFQMMAEDSQQMGQILKNFAMAGAALMYARYAARDNAVIG